MSSEVQFWSCPETNKLHITPGYKTSGQQRDLEEFKLRQLWGRAADGRISPTWILLPWCWCCVCWRQWRLSLTTIMTWAGSTATVRASTSSVPTARWWWPPGATTARRMAWTACGRLSASPHPRVWGSPATAGGTTSAGLGWSGGSSVVCLLSDHLLSTFFEMYRCEPRHTGRKSRLFRFYSENKCVVCVQRIQRLLEV